MLPGMTYDLQSDYLAATTENILQHLGPTASASNKIGFNAP